MPFTALASKANGSSNISRAEVQALFDNIAWLRCPPTYRVRAIVGNGETINSTLATLDLNTGFGDGGVFEWRQGGGGDQPNNTFTILTGGGYVNVGDVQAGVWVNGAMVAYETDPDALASATSEYWRRAVLERGDGTTFTQMADVTVQAGIGLATPRRCSLHLVGAGTFSSSTDHVRLRGAGGMTVDVLEQPQPDRRWGLWIAENAAPVGAYANARPTSTTQQVVWWNQMRANQYRLQRRPTAHRWKSGSNQAVAAATTAVVTMASSDWATDGALLTTNSFTATEAGWHDVAGQVTGVNMRSGASFITVTFRVNGATSAVTANASEIGASTGTTSAQVCGMLKLNAGDVVDMVAQSGIAWSIEASRGTQMWTALASSSAGCAPTTGANRRQVFHQMPPPEQIPNFAAYSSDHLPLGVMKIASDLTDRLRHRPVVWLRQTDDQEVEQGKWTDVDCSVIGDDYTGLIAAGFPVSSNGGFKPPWPSKWVVYGKVQFSTLPSEGGATIGGQGHRGMRFRLNGNHSAGQILTAAMNSNGHSWTKTICEEFVINDTESEIKLQAFISGLNNAEKSGVVTNCEIWAREAGDGTTWYPKGEP